MNVKEASGWAWITEKIFDITGTLAHISFFKDYMRICRIRPSLYYPILKV